MSLKKKETSVLSYYREVVDKARSDTYERGYCDAVEDIQNVYHIEIVPKKHESKYKVYYPNKFNYIHIIDNLSSKTFKTVSWTMEEFQSYVNNNNPKIVVGDTSSRYCLLLGINYRLMTYVSKIFFTDDESEARSTYDSWLKASDYDGDSDFFGYKRLATLLDVKEMKELASKDVDID